MKAIEVRGAYNYDSDAVAKACGTVFDPDEDRTQQQFAEEADINTIVKRFGLTGELPSPVSVPMTGDFTGATDFHTAMNLVVQADSEFMRLPAELRRRFEHDAGNLLAFLEDPANREEAVKLGLVAPAPEVVQNGVADVPASKE